VQDRTDVDDRAVDAAAGVEPGERQQRVEHLRHAPADLLDVAQGGAVVGWVTVPAQRDLGGALHDRDRVAQLVRRVGGESALPLDRRAQRRERLVEQRGEPVDRVAGAAPAARSPRGRRARARPRRRVVRAAR
jgi:hypothetical protein